MPQILYFHGIFGGPDSPKVRAMRTRFGDDRVQAPEFPFSRAALARCGRAGLLQTVAGMGAESERIALGAYDAHKPDILVGSSLGGALAMRLAADKHLPAILIAPVWNTQIKESYLPQFLAVRNPGLKKFESLIPLLTPSLLGFIREAVGFQFLGRVEPRTLILHSPDDELFDIKQSRTLLASGPLPAGNADADFMTSITDALVQRSYQVEGRLVLVGGDHQMNGEDALLALVDAAGLLAGEIE